jgi:CheY-like chemotaxis protein
MPGNTAVDQLGFRRIIRRNIALPIGAGLTTAAVFVALLFHLLSAMDWLDHSERVVADGNDLIKIAVDRESGMQGFLVTGDDSHLAPYELGRASFTAKLATLTDLVGDNPPQIERLKRIGALEAQSNEIAEQLITLRRSNQDYQGVMRIGKGKLEFDEMRREFTTFMDVELNLRWERTATVRRSEARNGFEAITQLNETPDIDLVLMDVMMPGMDGLEATRRIRTDPRFASLPIIAITAKAMKDDQEQTRVAGMTDYLAKPIDLDRLYSLLRVWLPSLQRMQG